MNQDPECILGKYGVTGREGLTRWARGRVVVARAELVRHPAFSLVDSISSLLCVLSLAMFEKQAWGKFHSFVSRKPHRDQGM